MKYYLNLRGLDGIYKQIEIAGRHCYKSEDKITETSAKEFVKRMIKSGHGAMLEHGTVYLTHPIENSRSSLYWGIGTKYRENKYFMLYEIARLSVFLNALSSNHILFNSLYSSSFVVSTIRCHTLRVHCISKL